jgi:hypothetical protein
MQKTRILKESSAQRETMLIQEGVMLGWMQQPGPLKRDIVWKVKLAFLQNKRTENVTIRQKIEWGNKIRASCPRDGTPEYSYW